jgi:hypothetical protein
MKKITRGRDGERKAVKRAKVWQDLPRRAGDHLQVVSLVTDPDADEPEIGQ